MSRDISQGIDPSNNYLSSAFGNGLNNTLQRMLGTESTGPCFCAECGKKLEAQIFSNPNGSSDKYCKEHYAQLFSNLICEGCHKPIAGQYAIQNDKKYHVQCSNQDIGCTGCHQRIFGQVLTACGSNWHPKCFKCTLCYCALSNNYFERQSLPYCEKCNTTPENFVLKKNTGSPITVVSNPEAVKNNEINKKIGQNIQQGKTFCAGCGKVIGNTDAVNFNNSVYHSYCLVCAGCGGDLEGGLTQKDGQPYCAKCSGSTGGFCGGCGQKLSGTFVNALGQKWHKNCFVCTGCKQPFTTGYAERESMPYCASCIQKGTKPTNTTMITGERKEGWTIDPRTGQKKIWKTINQ